MGLLQRLGGRRFQETIQLALDGDPEGGAEVLNGVIVTVPLSTLEEACIATLSLTALASNFSQAQLFNPAESGVDIHVEQAVFFHSAVATDSNFWFYSYDTALTTQGTASCIHRQANGTYVPKGQARFQQAAALGSLLFQYRAIVNNEAMVIPFPQGTILEPGTGIHTLAPVNQAQLTVWRWTERPARRG